MFLVDIIALRDQTLETFKEDLPNEPRWSKQDNKRNRNRQTNLCFNVSDYVERNSQ